MARALHAVALAALLVLAGCTGAPSATSPTETPLNPQTTATPTPTDATTTETPTTRDGYYRAYTVRAAETTIGDVAAEIALSLAELERWHEDRAAVVRAAAATGSASRVKLDPEVSLDLDGELVVVDGTYYRVNATVDSRERVTAHHIDADGPLGNRYEGDELDAYRERAVDHGALPPADRRAVADTVGIADEPYRNFHGIGNWHYFENGTVPDNSTLADGGTHVVRYNDTLWKMQLSPSRTSEQSRYRVTYTLDTVAENESAWRDYVRRNNVTALGNVSVGADARDVLRSAIEDGSVEWEGTSQETPQRFEALFRHSSRYYIAQNGAIYRIIVREIVE